MKSQSIIVFYKKGSKRIFLFEADDIDDMFQALEYDAFKDKKGRAYFLVDGVEIKFTEVSFRNLIKKTQKLLKQFLS